MVVGLAVLVLVFLTQDWPLVKDNFAVFLLREFGLGSLSTTYLITGVVVTINDHVHAFPHDFPLTSASTLRTLKVASIAGLCVVLVVCACSAGVKWLATNPWNSDPPAPPRAGTDVVDFASWETFGSVESQLSDSAHHVALNTHDTVASWTTKWSGLIWPRIDRMCSAHMTGNVRDQSHMPGTQGGFGIGLGEMIPADGELSGIAVQFDYAFQGYRTVNYPADLVTPVAEAPLDNTWHSVDLTIGADGKTTLLVDGALAATGNGEPTCGFPLLRIWGGAAEFSNFTIQTA